MGDRDRLRWDARYGDVGAAAPSPAPALPEVFCAHAARFPSAGEALELACGTGASAVWMAERGMEVCATDISPVALDRARQLADDHGVGHRCRFVLADLDRGLPTGPPAAVILCHMFRDPRLYAPMAARLAPGGLLAVAVLSEVGDRPGPFRAARGELGRAFGSLHFLAGDEGEGRAWLLAEKPLLYPPPLARPERDFRPEPFPRCPDPK
jgi:SAM-dependent methyltransferase